MLNATITKTIVLFSIAIASCSATSQAATEHIQIGELVTVVERNILGQMENSQLRVNVVRNGIIGITRQKGQRFIGAIVAAQHVDEMISVFKKGKRWAALAKERKVNVEKVLGFYEIPKRSSMRFTFVSAEDSGLIYIQMEMRHKHKTATFYLLPQTLDKLINLLEAAPEYVEKLKQKIEKEESTEKLFN